MPLTTPGLTVARHRALTLVVLLAAMALAALWFPTPAIMQGDVSQSRRDEERIPQPRSRQDLQQRMGAG